jgi:putative ATPase
MTKAKQAASEYGNLPVPIHLRNAPTKMMKDLGYGKGHDLHADFKHAEGFLPAEISDLDLF